jgi:hypothetical protein
VSWPRNRSLVVVALGCCWLAWPSTAWASKTGYPFWTFTSANGAMASDPTTGSFSLQTFYDGQNTPVAGGNYLISNGASAQTMATDMAAELNASAQKTYWVFTAAADPKIANRWNVTAAPAAGLTATPKAIYVKASLGTSNIAVRGAKVSSGVDPLIGTAHYQLTGTANGNGNVSLGIEGLTFTTATYDLGSGFPLTSIQIEQNLLAELKVGGFSQAFLDADTGILSVPDITTGDPLGGDGSDIGSFLSNDGDTGNLVTLSDIVVPEPSSFVLAVLGLTGVVAWGWRK